MEEKDPLLRDVPRDEHGHIRLAEVPIAKVLRTGVTEALGKRGVKLTIGEKDVGYEVRCGYPTAFDRDYTRDLGDVERADHPAGAADRAGSLRRDPRSEDRQGPRARGGRRLGLLPERVGPPGGGHRPGPPGAPPAPR